MKELTVTFRLEEDDDILGYAMDIAQHVISIYDFEKAELDGKLLINKDAAAPDEVKRLPQYKHVLKQLRMRRTE